MTRLPPAARDGLHDDLKRIFDDISAGSDGIGNAGPMSILKYSPELARRVKPVYQFMRNGITLPPPVRELAMLVAGRAADCPYVWNRHAALARKSGLGDELVDALRDRKPLPPMSAQESLVIALGMELFRNHRISQETFDAALTQFGKQGLVELVALMGFYGMLAFITNAVEITLPDGLSEPPMPA
jgi:4-carboxymuconolactone decarboxylase